MTSRTNYIALCLGTVATLAIYTNPAMAQIDQIIDTINETVAEDGSQPAADQTQTEVLDSGLAVDPAAQPTEGQQMIEGAVVDPASAPDAASTASVTPTAVSPAAASVNPEQAKTQMTQRAGLLPADVESVVFTYWEYTALMDAKKSRQSTGVQRGVTEDELNQAMQNQANQAEKPVPPPEEREITLGGIVYTKSNDWTIWLNGQRVTPDALPEQIIDLKVTKYYIDVKWLDDYTQKLYPIRLRAHQRFNLDARIFLPG